LLRIRKLLEEFRTAHRQGIQVNDLVVGKRIGDAFRTKLFLDVGPNSDFLDALDVARTCAKSKPVKDMRDFLIFRNPSWGGDCSRRKEKEGQKNQNNGANRFVFHGEIDQAMNAWV
jgi:hypothetical protein